MLLCSTCQEEGTCQEQLTSDEYWKLCLYGAASTVMPIAIPVLSRQLSARFCRMRIQDQDSVFQDPAFDVLKSSGLNVLLFIWMCGFNVVFFVSISGYGYGCSGPLGACGSISCVAGTYETRLYVFMQVLLTLIPLLIVREVHAIFASHTSPTRLLRTCKYLITCSMLLTTMTGIFPEVHDTDVYSVDDDNAANSVYFKMHTVGAGTGIVVPIVALFFAFCYIFVKALRSGSQFISPVGLAVRIVFFLMFLGSLKIFLNNLASADTLDYCSELVTEAECNAFPQNDGNSGECVFEGPLWRQVHFNCVWRHPRHSRFTRAVLSQTAPGWEGRCQRHECELYRNAFSICAEYALLFVPLCYVVSFGLSDLKYFIAPHSVVRYEEAHSSKSMQQGAHVVGDVASDQLWRL